ncbi:4Fe-4S dicluster domain-containing protein [Dissulfurirhabdus thermomarina]|uniref:4Fe-4S dicluster domain-containing protein n=1 Tax=Dissulfurirhabdus thermomarina TaxID=1765737 RepID=A0A6N9TRJ8_DISTH|nr:NIL domain-containing protein [Dissulfurirhabdus thermomarina]NDY42374.1 4Fe-4S dicluster domain-containing protein [Dissulfurirhabdus thermomarina]NMX23490.1 4Fe-4S binding protein [Dissulfurirhabdus thermomarina]
MYTRMLVLRFPREITDQPLVCNLSRDYDLCFNILKATVLPGQDGLMVIEISGHKKNVSQGLKYLRSRGVNVKSVAQQIRRRTETCIQCGACTGICPTHALFLDPATMEVGFDPKRCSGCELCVSVCPVRAMEIRLDKESVLA